MDEFFNGFLVEDEVEEPRVLEAQPRVLDFELLPIYETKTKWFRVANRGDNCMEAELIVIHEQWLRDFPHDLVIVNPNSIKLQPNETCMISVSVRPRRANIQNFFILYEPIINGEVVDTVLDGGGGYGIEVHDNDIHGKHLVDVTFVGDHAIFEVTDVLFVAKHPVWNAQQCRHMFSMDLLNQCLNPYSHTVDDGRVPLPPIVQFRFPPATIGSETSVFQVQLHNSMDLKGSWEIFTMPPLNWHKLLQNKLKRRHKSLTSRLVIIDGRVKDSPELLAALWARKFGFSRNTDCSKNRYRTPAITKEESENNQKCAINAKRVAELFKVSPLRGTLNGKESRTITFKYSFERPGHHQMSILLRVYPAIFVWIDLTSQTLDVNEPFIQLMEHRVMKFKPISVEDLDPPMQMLWAYNGGNIPAGFSVDMEPFHKLKEDNFNHAAIECLTPSGIVPPRSWFPIKLRFSPLEFTDYSVPLRVHPEFSEKAMEVVLKGSALFATATRLRPDAAMSKLKAFAMTDAVPVTLSPTQIAIPHFVPTGQKATSCVFLTNLHAKHHMSFRWPEVPIEGDGTIRFQPERGIIAPSGGVTCLVIVTAGKAPVTFSTMIRCMLEDEDEKSNYNFEFNQWKIKMEFIDTSKPRGTRRNPAVIPQQPTPPEPFSCLLALSVYIGTVFGLYDIITPKERSRMPHTDPVTVNRPIPADPDLPSGLILSEFEREMSAEIISNLLLDIITAPGFENSVRTLTKRHPPLYEDYKESEDQQFQTRNEMEQTPELHQQTVEEILEATVFNLIQELNSNYVDPETRDKWHDLTPVQPTALINVVENSDCF